uniref:Response regulator receiver protein n=1 Tax=Cyanothece sp. (strain PCC 7425 / ATCC 29141) TaxID=395961 RepID=B8HY39_CYAP4
MRVLIADSSPFVGTALGWELEGFGVETKVVDSIARVKVEIEAIQPDLLVTELFLKDGDFLVLAAYRPHFPILLLSTHQVAVDDADVISAVDACLLKPIKAIDLISIANKLVFKRPHCLNQTEQLKV